MKTASLVLFLFLVSVSAYAQDSSAAKIRKFSVAEINLLPGYYIMNTAFSATNQFKELTGNHPGLAYSPDFSNNGYANGGIAALLGFKLRNTSKTGYRKNTMLRVGFSYYSGASLGLTTQQSSYKEFDSYTSPVTGQKVSFDSAYYDTYQYTYNMQQLRLDVSMIYHTNQAARWSLYGGFGFSAGIGFNAHTLIQHSTSNVTEVRIQDQLSYNGGGKYEYSSQQINNRPGQNFSVYFPAGIDFRVGRKDPFWSRVHMIYELRMGFGVTRIPELQTYFYPMVQQHFGIKITF